MAVIKHTRPISLTAFSLQQRLYLCLAVNRSGSIQKESQPLMKRQYPGKRTKLCKITAPPPNMGRKVRLVEGLDRYEKWLAAWAINDQTFWCGSWGRTSEGRRPKSSLICCLCLCRVNMVPLSCVIRSQSDIGTCFCVVSSPFDGFKTWAQERQL